MTACVALLLMAVQDGPQWQAPVEVLKTEGRGRVWPMETFRSAGGTLGVMVMAKKAGTTLYLRKPGEASWSELGLGVGLPGAPLVEGESVRFLFSDMGARKVRFATVDAAKGTHAEVDVPGAAPSTPMLSHVVAGGKSLYGVVGCERGQVLFTSSGDGGKTWSELAEIGQNEVTDDQICPPLFATEGGLHLVHVAKGDGLVRRTSKDGGKTWEKAKSAPAIPKDAQAGFAAGVQVGKALHVVCVVLAGGDLQHAHSMSADGGETWSACTLLGKNRPSDVGMFIQVRGAGDAVALAYTEPGKSDLHARRAHLWRSADGGKTWTEEAATDRVIGDTGRPSVWVDADGRALLGFVAGPEEGAGGDTYVLVRALEKGAPKEPAGKPAWWK